MNHLEITTILPCINNCSYCPQKMLRDAYKKVPNNERKLTLDKFKELLKNVPKDIEIHFSGFSEPFGNRESSKMMKYASDNGYNVVVYSTLNDITQEDIDIIKDIPFKEFYVHLIGIKLPELPFKYATIKVEIPISRAGNLWEIPKTTKMNCSRNSGFKQNVVLPNGDVYLCCQDYGLKHHLGNLFEENFNDLRREYVYELCRTCEFNC